MRIVLFIFSCTLFCLTLFKSTNSFSQNQVDSLNQLAINELDEKEKAAIFYDIADIYYYNNLDSSLHYIQQYLKASENANDTAWIADAYNYMAYIYDEKGEIELALEYFEKALEGFLIIQDSFFIASCYINIGYMTSYGLDQAKGLNYFLEAYQIAETIQDSGLLADAGSNIAYYYERVEDNTTALRYYEKVLEYSLAIYDSIYVALSYADLANMNFKMDRYKNAENLLAKSKQMISNSHRDYDLAYLYSSYVESFILSEQKDSALFYINKTEEHTSKLTNRLLEAYLYQHKGYLAFLNEEYKDCFEYLEKSIALFKKINSIEPLSETYAKQAEAYAKLQMFPQAYKSLHLANTLIDSLGYGILANTLGEFEQKRIHRIETEKHLLETELSNQKFKSSQIKSKTNLAIALFSILFLMLIIGITLLSFFKIRNKNSILNDNNKLIKKQKEIAEISLNKLELSEKKLIKLNKTKDKFFSIIGHDLKNPFNALAGLTEVLIKNKELRESKKVVSILENMNKTAIYGYSLLENLLDWSRSQTGAIKPKPKKIILSQTIEKAVQDFNAIASDKKIKLNFEIDSETEVLADENMITTVLRNLIHNAVKYSFENGQVKITSRKEENYLVTSIEDHGIGATEKELSCLFTMDNQYQKEGTKREKGTGLGLILCKEFITKNKGEIWAEGQEDKGCKFSFSLPIFQKN